MTQDFSGYPLGDGDQSAQPSAAGVAREQAAGVGQSAREAGSQVAETAAERAKDVMSEAQWQGRDLLGQAQQQVRDQAQAQQHKAAGRMRGLAGELSVMAANGDQGSSAAVLVREAAGSLHDAASWLERHKPEDLVGLIAFGAGWLVSSLIPASSAEKQLAVQVKQTVAESPVAQQLGQAAKETTQQLRDSAMRAAQSVKDTAAEAAADVTEQARSAAGDVTARAQDAKDTVTEQARPSSP